MPDVIPTETYIHHTLQRSLELPQILSPVPAKPPMAMVQPIFYDSATTLPIASRRGDVHAGTLSRNPHMNSGTLKLGSADEELNDAYYTFTARRHKPPATTFT